MMVKVGGQNADRLDGTVVEPDDEPLRTAQQAADQAVFLTLANMCVCLAAPSARVDEMWRLLREAYDRVKVDEEDGKLVYSVDGKRYESWSDTAVDAADRLSVMGVDAAWVKHVRGSDESARYWLAKSTCERHFRKDHPELEQRRIDRFKGYKTNIQCSLGDNYHDGRFWPIVGDDGNAPFVWTTRNGKPPGPMHVSVFFDASLFRLPDDESWSQFTWPAAKKAHRSISKRSSDEQEKSQQERPTSVSPAERLVEAMSGHETFTADDVVEAVKASGTKPEWAKKYVQDQLSTMTHDGLVERTRRGVYRIKRAP